MTLVYCWMCLWFWWNIIRISICQFRRQWCKLTYENQISERIFSYRIINSEWLFGIEVFSWQLKIKLKLEANRIELPIYICSKFQRIILWIKSYLKIDIANKHLPVKWNRSLIKILRNELNDRSINKDALFEIQPTICNAWYCSPLCQYECWVRLFLYAD